MTGSVAAAAVAAVFMYHHVSAQTYGGAYGHALTVTPNEFDGQLRWLHDRGCAAVGIDQLVNDVAGARVRGCEVALTFDDGYADAAAVAEPILRRYGDVATFFVTTGYLGTPGHLTSSQVRALANDGMEIGAHTVSHPDLTTVADAKAAEEIAKSRAVLRALSGQPVDAFAYPAGRYDARIEAIVKRAGYRIAVATESGDLTRSALARDMYALPRYRVLRARGSALLAHALAPARGAAGARSPSEVRAIARLRIAGNAPDIAERVAVALLSGDFPEPILKVRVLKIAPAAVAGIMLSGVKFHGPVSRQSFAADAAEMIYRAFAADPSVSEVDVWAVVPVAVSPTATVSGDLAVPTNRTVFSASVLRGQWAREENGLGTTYWEPDWLEAGRR